MGGRGSSSGLTSWRQRSTRSLEIEQADLSKRTIPFKERMRLRRSTDPEEQKQYQNLLRDEEKKKARIAEIKEELDKRRLFYKPSKEEEAISQEISGLLREANAPSGYHRARGKRLEQVGRLMGQSQQSIEQESRQRKAAQKQYEKQAYKKSRRVAS